MVTLLMCYQNLYLMSPRIPFPAEALPRGFKHGLIQPVHCQDPSRAMPYTLGCGQGSMPIFNQDPSIDSPGCVQNTVVHLRETVYQRQRPAGPIGL